MPPFMGVSFGRSANETPNEVHLHAPTAGHPGPTEGPGRASSFGGSPLELMKLANLLKKKNKSGDVFSIVMKMIGEGKQVTEFLGGGPTAQAAAGIFRDIHGDLSSQNLPFNIKDKRVLGTIANRVVRETGMELSADDLAMFL